MISTVFFTPGKLFLKNIISKIWFKIIFCLNTLKWPETVNYKVFLGKFFDRSIKSINNQNKNYFLYDNLKEQILIFKIINILPYLFENKHSHFKSNINIFTNNETNLI